MMTITHTHADGTLIDGSAKGDGVYDVLKGLRDNWRYFPSIRRIGLGQSRDRNADTWKIKRAAEALRAAGHEVTVTVDESQRRDVATIEAERVERAEARAERYGERAERTGAQAQAGYERAREMAEAIPFGQPMMPGHHSYRRDVNYRARIDRTYGRAFEGMDEAKELARRAESAEATQAHRESVPATLRRIEKLEATERDLGRKLGLRKELIQNTLGEPMYTLMQTCGPRRAQLLAALADVQEQLAYWRGHVRAAEVSGVKVWSREDFTRGDFVRYRDFGWYEVLRVNAKSLTIPAIINDGPVVRREDARCTWTDSAPYHKVTGRKSAAEMAAMIAEAEHASA